MKYASLFLLVLALFFGAVIGTVATQRASANNANWYRVDTPCPGSNKVAYGWAIESRNNTEAVVCTDGELWIWRP